MNKQILLLAALALIMVLLPHHLRFAEGNNTIAGVEPYYHANMIGRAAEQPYQFVLSAAYRLMDARAFTVVPIVFAFLSFILFWLFLRCLEIPVKMQVWMLLVYALSPMLISLSLFGTPSGLILCSILAGAILMSHKTYWPAGIIAFVIVGLSGSLAIIAALTVLWVLVLWKNESQRHFIAMAVLVAFLVRESPASVDIPRSLAQFVSDVGGVYGLSIFALLLAIVGAALVWSHKKKYYGAFALCIAFFFCSFFFPSLLVYANVLVACLAGVALFTLSERKWKLQFLRNASLLVLFCGLLFSAISHAGVLADSQPEREIFDVLDVPRGVILTHESYGFWVKYAGHTPVIDSFSKKNARATYGDVMTALHSTDFDDTMHILKKYNVQYILISEEMKHGLVWEREERGLDFIVENSERFKRLKKGDTFELWALT